MIHSSVKDNWTRLEIIHSVAREYFNFTADSDFRQRMNNRGNLFPFHVSEFEQMEKESCLVGMVMVWSVVTLESLVNHALAVTFNDKDSAIEAIEYPKNAINRLKIKTKSKSELAKKITILASAKGTKCSVLELADNLADTRNSIVHDKPFSLFENGEIEHFRNRGESEGGRFKFEQLGDFFEVCDNVKDFIVLNIDLESIDANDVNFGSLKVK